MTKFQHTAARRRLHGLSWSDVTTNLFQHTAARRRLPEEVDVVAYVILSFNTQPPEGGCSSVGPFLGRKFVSTHSRPKAAAFFQHLRRINLAVSTHSRPKAAAGNTAHFFSRQPVSTHSRPKAAAHKSGWTPAAQLCFNTQPPEGGCIQVVVGE